MGRIRDWLASHTAARRFSRLEREAREVILECTDTLEKLNTMAARLAKREARARREAADAAQADEQPAQRVVGARDHKAALRARAARQLNLPVPHHREVMPQGETDP